jgi:hypothetical protein
MGENMLTLRTCTAAQRLLYTEMVKDGPDRNASFSLK